MRLHMFRNVRRFWLVSMLLFPTLGAWALDANVLIENRTFLPSEGAVFEIATNTVTAGTNVIVESGADVTFVGGQSVVLRPGFTVRKGAAFTAGLGDMDGSTITTDNVSWEGSHYIAGDLTITGGGVLHLEEGSSITFLSGGALIVDGELVATGVLLTGANRTPGGWQGIRAAGTVTLVDVTVEYARQGLLLYDNHRGSVHLSTFRYNTVGIHVVGPPEPLSFSRVSHTAFLSNDWYGIKEDPDAIDRYGRIDSRYNDFQHNLRHYYLDEIGAISINRLNALPENWGNRDLGN